MGVITWQGSTPVSTVYDDPYYSPENGLAEADYVFLQGNNLPHGWHGKAQFIIAELGFGTGLNFFLTLKRWHETQPASARLTYISFEKHPMPLAEIQRALSAFPDLTAEVELFSPPGREAALAGDTCYGQLRWKVPQHNVFLEVWVGDVEETLPRAQFNANAWYLDGFAPAKNPAMWQPHILQGVGNCTATNGTCATFTAAGEVRRNLEKAGFLVERIKGYGHKRHMTTGVKRAMPA